MLKNNNDGINLERTARLWYGFTFNGHRYRDDSAGFALLKAEALSESIMQGNKIFRWITADNKIVELTTIEAIALCEYYFDWRSNIYLKAREIKDMDNQAIDYKDTVYWE